MRESGLTVNRHATGMMQTRRRRWPAMFSLPLAAAMAILVVAPSAIARATGKPVIGARPGIAAAKVIQPYYALGDSYSAGEGVPPVDTSADGCRQSQSGAYPQVFDAKTKHYQMHAFAACSGAVINDIAGSQLTVLRPGPALVTLTAGGNDAGFAQVLQDCITGDCVTSDSGESAVINGLLGPLYNAYLRVKAAAPHLRIIVLTYPQFVTAKGAPCAGTGWLSAKKVTWIRARTAQLDAVIKKAAAAAGVQVLDVQNAFSGHEICTGTPGPKGSWVNGIQFSDLHYWFHPNQYGQQKLAAALLARVG